MLHYQLFLNQKSKDYIILIHGFMENLSIWDSFIYKLLTKYNIVTLDLPDHGQSKNIFNNKNLPTLYDFSTKIIEIINKLNINKAYFIGHSLGGYIVMHILEKYPKKIQKICLFFSSPFDDDIQKKKNRDDHITLVKKNKLFFIKKNIPKLFNSLNIEKLTQEINYTKNIASKTSNKGIINALYAMKNRKNLSYLFNITNIPILLISGEFDKTISLKKIKSELIFNKKKIHKILPVGHMGHLEDPIQTLNLIFNF